jgi:hypothetical protein
VWENVRNVRAFLRHDVTYSLAQWEVFAAFLRILFCRDEWGTAAAIAAADKM